MESASIEPSEPKEDEGPKEREKRPKFDKPNPPAPEPRSSVMTDIARVEEQSLRDWLRSLAGANSSIKIVVTRSKPEKVRNPVTGDDINCGGHLATYDELFDEDFLQTEWGGGTYQIKPMLMSASGSFEYKKGAHRIIRISGEPRLERIRGYPTASSAASPGAVQGEAPELAKAAMGVMERLLDRKERDKPDDGIPAGVQLAIDQMHRAAEARDREIAELRREAAATRNQKPAENPLIDKILANAIDGQSGHVEALRLRHEAELRQIKESAIQDQKRIEDRHDRQLSEMRQSHEFALSGMRSSYEREIAAMRSSNEVTLAAERASHNVQLHTIKGDVTRLERDNADLRHEVKELREKKDKSIIEQIKDIKTIKETFLDEEGEETSAFGKIASAITPENIAAVGSMFRAPGATGQPGPPQAPPQQVLPRKRVVQARDPKDGQIKTFVQDEMGKLNLATRKPKMVEGADGKPIEVPPIDPTQLTQIVSYLEQAFGNSVDPDIIAQSARSYIPQDIMTWLRANDTEQVSGIDLFMSRVARLPGSSPLATQKGKNWLRQVGKALVS